MLEMSTPVPSSSANYSNQQYQLEDLSRNHISGTAAAIVKVYPQLHRFPEMLDSLRQGGEHDERELVGAPLLTCATKECCLASSGVSCCRPGEQGCGAVQPDVGELCLLSNCNVPGCVNNSSNPNHRAFKGLGHNVPSDESSPLTPRKHPYSIVPLKSLHEIEAGNILAKKEGK